MTGTFTSTGNLNTAIYQHTATLLSDGKVLIAGGFNNSGILVNAELYDPGTGTFTTTGNLNDSRASHTATLLSFVGSGMVLIAAGTSNNALTSDSAELYDPSSGVFTPTGSLNTSRLNHSATLLFDGRVLIAGGQQFDGVGYVILGSAELYHQ
jgi:hypothetical protein